jgi:hypothetical protein
LRRRSGEPMDFEQHGADRNHEHSKIDHKLHCLAQPISSAQAKRRPRGAGSRRPGNPSKFNPRYLLGAEPPGAVGRLIGAVRGAKRTVSGGAGVDVATRFRFGRSHAWRRGLCGRAGRRASGRSCRCGKCWWNDWSTNRRAWRRRHSLRGWRLHRRSRCGGAQACRGIDHGRHRGRKPVEPQQHAAKSNHQHGTIDR